MDERVFDQLDKLERSTFELYQEPYSMVGDDHPGRRGGRSSMEYASTSDPPDPSKFRTEPFQLDDFDELLLHQAEHDSRHEQAAEGRARLSLAPSACDLPPVSQHIGLQSIDGPDFSRLSFDPVHSRRSSPISAPIQRHRSTLTCEYATSSPKFVPVNRERWHSPKHPTFRNEHGSSKDCLPSQAPSALLARTPQISAERPTNKEPPIVQGIPLIPVSDIPDRFRSIFPFPIFNAVQSKCFDIIYRTNDNFVVSAPTSSGKTAVLELAVCRLASSLDDTSFKVVYMAPTKALCSERQRDWQVKFSVLNMQCAELTGDTDPTQLRLVQHANIIVTTPEKWDSVTRKWKDHEKLMQLVKLMLIDEVHLLKEDRGATLEAVVSRMKSVCSRIRFVALSATVPNSHDIATWLGKDSFYPSVPAPREKFGEEFRPVRLQRHVCGYKGSHNDFAFDKLLNNKLPDIITAWSRHKPIMVFCFTRKSCEEAAQLLSAWWSSGNPNNRYWPTPRSQIIVKDRNLRHVISTGVAFHHAAMCMEDRNAVQKGYVDGDINVICCTSTLAVGVNLPCHMVIVKHTVTYGNSRVCKEYSDLEIMQMLGRAGRPQFDDSAMAVIMTRYSQIQFYENLMSGQEVLESRLHLNLIDHLNAEIGLGTITNVETAKKWLTSTFLYVRLKENPEHYKIAENAPGRNLDERLENICKKGIDLLEQNDLIRGTAKVECTEFGDAMTRYYLQFDTMKNLLALPCKAKTSEILSAISQAAEFREVRFRSGEKSVYKELNKNGSVKFPIPVNIDIPAHKVSLIIQSVLGSIDLPTEDEKHRAEYLTSKMIIFQHVNRLVRCIIDCQLYLDDSIAARNALMLARSFGAQVWDDSPFYLKQLDGIGPAMVRKLAAAGIKSIEDLEEVESHCIEVATSRNPPYGRQLQDRARLFPRLRISMKTVGDPAIKKGQCVTVRVRAEIGFLNEHTPEYFSHKAVYVCLLADTSDGRKSHFARISAKKLNKGQEVLFSVDLNVPGQSIRGSIMCDEIAGTQQSVTLKPEIPAFMFPTSKALEGSKKERHLRKSRLETTTLRTVPATRSPSDIEDFGDADIDDVDLEAVANAGGFVDIDEYDDDGNRKSGWKNGIREEKPLPTQLDETWSPRRLDNGKWACNHRCLDKSACKHPCCREGLDRKPKPPKSKLGAQKSVGAPDLKQTHLEMSRGKIFNAGSSSAADSSRASTSRKPNDCQEVLDLTCLHNSVESSTPAVPLLKNRQGTEARACAVEATRKQLQPPNLFRCVDDGTASSDNSLEFRANDDPSDQPYLTGTQTAAYTSPSGSNLMSEGVAEEMMDAMEPKTSPRTHADHVQPEHILTGGVEDDDQNHEENRNAREDDSLFVTIHSDNLGSKRLAEYSPGRLDSYRPAKASRVAVQDNGASRLHAESRHSPPARALRSPPSAAEMSTREWFEREFGTEMFNFI